MSRPNGRESVAGEILGEFQVTGDKLMVTDPCYTRSTWCQGIVENALPGTWEGNAEYTDEGSWGERVSAVEARHESFRESVGRWETAGFEVGVDSGQAGIFDEARYPKSECGEYDERGSFYNRACHATAGSNPCDEERSERSDEKGGAIDEGVVTSSGYGDGGYECRIHRNAEGKADAVRVTFIADGDGDEGELDESEEEELEDEDVCEDCGSYLEDDGTCSSCEEET